MTIKQKASVERLKHSLFDKEFDDLEIVLGAINEIEKDKARLDWIQKTKHSIDFAGSIDAKFYIQASGQVIGSVSRSASVRAAIDAAMKGSQ